jgi:hypothetical protein
MAASIAIGKCASESVDVNLAVFHCLIRAEQGESLCRWFRQGRYASIGEAWSDCAQPQWMLALLELFRLDDEMTMRKATLRFIRATPTGNGAAIADLLDEPCRQALRVGERYADGRATEAELRKAQQRVAAEDRALKRKLRRPSTRRLVLQAGYWALGSRELFDARTICSLTVRAAVQTKTPKHHAKRFQADLLRSVFGQPFHR